MENIAEYVEIVKNGKNAENKLFSWDKLLEAWRKDGDMFIPAEAFPNCFPKCKPPALKPGTTVEIAIKPPLNVKDTRKYRWFATIRLVSGFYVLLEFVNLEKKFVWMHMLSDEIYPLYHAVMNDPNMLETGYLPPVPIVKQEDQEITPNKILKHFLLDEKFNKNALSPSFEELKKELIEPPIFRIGQRLELLNVSKTSEIRVARIQKICGRRLMVLVTRDDMPLRKFLAKKAYDGQLEHQNHEFWVDQSSFLIFPVGFAMSNGLGITASTEYLKHCREICQKIDNDKEPDYDEIDVTPQQIGRELSKTSRRIKINQKFEMIEPINDNFKALRVGSVRKILKTPGYVLIGMEGSEESYPIHLKSCDFIYPPGFGECYRLEVVAPPEYEEKFDWNEFLKKENAEELPSTVFEKYPSQTKINFFKDMRKLEVADRTEPKNIYPARIVSRHGRIILIDFEGWGEEHHQLYDIESPELFPAGWCDYHDYPLKPIKTFASQ